MSDSETNSSDWRETNREAWNRRTEIHLDSKFYDVAAFLQGKNVLREIELHEIGDVKGKTMLHLQCHFGLDSLCWARLGASVTGVDLSDKAIASASELADKIGLNAQFVCSDLYEFGEIHTAQYDIVFSSYGALCWLPDIKRWADTVSRCLKPGGTFYIAEFHPAFDLFSGYSYFHQAEPIQAEPINDEEGTYTENDLGETMPMVTWGHPVSDVVTALIDAGICINLLNEYPFSPYNCFENMIEKQPGRFFLEHKGQNIPLVYSIRGTKLGARGSISI